MAVKKPTKKAVAKKKAYLTPKEKLSLIEDCNRLIVRLQKKHAAISDSYERTYLEDARQCVSKAKSNLLNIY